METEEITQKSRAKTMLVYVAILSIVMLFAAFTSAYVVTMGNGFWVDIKMPNAFYYSTVTILLSSLTMMFAVKFVRNNQLRLFKQFLILTFLLGLLFAFFQFKGWNQLLITGNYVSGDIANLKGEYGTDYTFSYQNNPLILEDGQFYLPQDVSRERPLNEELNGQFNAASGYFYIITWLHLMHLVGGLVYLLVVIYGATKERFSASNFLKPKLAGVYWHFLDILWIYLFFFLLFIH